MLEYIDSNEKLLDCCDFLKTTNYFSIDLEFDKNRLRYGFNLCLMQICHQDKSYIIDPLKKNLDLQPIFELITSNKILKLVFSFSEDLKLLKQLGCKANNTYDIATAIRFMNLPQLSLSNALEKLLDVKIIKTEQTSNWFKRPLDEKQINYAINDVLHLKALYDKILPFTHAHQFDQWIDEENFFAENNVSVEAAEFQLKYKDKKDLSEYDLHVFNELMQFREKVAKDFNRPSYMIMHKEFIRSVACDPSKIEDFFSEKGVYRKIHNASFYDKFNRHLKSATSSAEALGLSKERSALPRLNPKEMRSRKALRKFTEKVKKDVFKPIQKVIANDYGENLVTLILGNRIIDHYISGEDEAILEYKLKLIRDCAQKLSIDLNTARFSKIDSIF